jgi:hypothetical protein
MRRPLIPIPERNRQILQMRKDGVSRRAVAERFGLSTSRIRLLELRDADERAAARRRTAILEQMRASDDSERLWSILDVADALGLGRVVKKRLLAHFVRAGRDRISLRELMVMCLNAPDPMGNASCPPLLSVCGIGRKGFWSVINALTDAGLGPRSSEEWHARLDRVSRERGITQGRESHEGGAR